MSFNNDIAGGNGSLVRNWIQSANYVAGTTGWRIAKDGSAEFNNGTFRGSIEVGPIGGQHFIVNNPATGHIIDIYNGSNQLVFSINEFGIASSINPSTGIESSLQAGQLQLDNSPSDTNANIVLVPAVATNQQTLLELIVSPPIGTSYSLILEGGSDDGTLKPTLVGNERGVQGSIVQSDAHSSSNLIHAATYTFNTDAGGNATVNHGCGFTPKQGFLVGLQSGVGPFYGYAWYTAPFTASTFHANFITAAGATYANMNGAQAFGFFLG